MRSHRKPAPPADNSSREAHSIYTADLGVPDRCRYRRTPPGARTVSDLVRPGDTVSTSYGTEGVVIEVKEYFYVAPTGATLSHYTVIYVPSDSAATYRNADRHWINECVAMDGRILMLFEANTDEVFVVERARGLGTQPSRTILIT